MNRRTFIKSSVGALVTGSAAAGHPLSLRPATTLRSDDLPAGGIPSPHHLKVDLKPLMTNIIHSGVWEGPCRFNVVPVEEERARVRGHYDAWSSQLSTNQLGMDEESARLLEPDLILFSEDFKISEAEFDRIDRDGTRADAFLINPAGSSIATFKIAERYRKPVILSMGLNCRTVDIAAYCRSHGLEVHVPNGKEELNRLLSQMRARKVLSRTRILYPTDWGWPSVASVAGINRPEELRDTLGVELVRISYGDLAREMERRLRDDSERKKAEQVADLVIEKADRLFLDRRHVVRSMEFYHMIIGLMAEHDCNAFTIECFEFCSSKLPEKWDVTPCLVHTMFKDQGIPSACEGDLGALLSMQLLMALSRKSSHLGNMFLRAGGQMEINHSAPGIRMNGPDKPGLPYQLGRFVESGWGTKAVVDFMNNPEKRITVARMDPGATGVLVLKGRLVGSKGWGEDLLGCSVSAFVVGAESGAAEEFVRRQIDYGNHLAWVYGDYSEEMKGMGALLGMDVEVVS